MTEHSDSIIIRPGDPIIDEGLVYARYLDVAAEGFFRFMLGRRATEVLGKAYLQPGHNYSHENVVFAEHAGRIAGMASGFTSEQHRHFSERPLINAVGRGALRMRFVKTLCAPLLRILDTLADSDFYLLSVATDEGLRGKGIGSALIDAMEERATATGSSRLALDVSANNSGAIGLYKRRGMIIESQWPKRIVVPGLKMFRMTKTL